MWGWTGNGPRLKDRHTDPDLFSLKMETKQNKSKDSYPISLSHQRLGGSNLSPCTPGWPPVGLSLSDPPPPSYPGSFHPRYCTYSGARLRSHSLTSLLRLARTMPWRQRDVFSCYWTAQKYFSNGMDGTSARHRTFLWAPFSSPDNQILILNIF